MNNTQPAQNSPDTGAGPLRPVPSGPMALQECDTRNSDSGNTLDFAMLTEMKQELGDSFSTVMQHFQAGMLARPEKISLALQANDPELLARESHSFKSVCKQLGLTQMGQVAANLEAIGRTGRLAEAEPLVGQLIAAGAWAHRELKKYCAASGPPPPFFQKTASAPLRG
ncbi:MAG: Hpt domain-containing protein [Magnetococcales bacterium]|nr:Hpt domain-containing protein [Magnetococcales bacterium]MBF0582863.1 Hpt domain-containing protein [Magnetococcales bacterium]